MSQRHDPELAVLTAATPETAAQGTEGGAAQTGEAQLRRTLDVAGIGTWDWDVARDRITESPLTGALLGSGPQPGETTFAEFLARVHPDDHAEVRRAILAALDEATVYEIEFRVPTAEGGVRWIAAKGQIIRACPTSPIGQTNQNVQAKQSGQNGRSDQGSAHPLGRPVHVTGIMTDITAHKESKAHEEMLARGEKLRALGQMAGGIAHDLNQALAVVSGYADLAREALAEGEAGEAADQLDIIAQAARQGAETVKRLLTFTRQDDPGLVESVEIGQVIDEAARFTAPRWRDAAQAEGRPIRLDVTAEAGLRIQGLTYALREALINLILNAVDALPRGGEIRLSAQRRGEHVEVTVADTGIGMSPAVQRRIFEPFFTTKGERGNGLGLAMVFAIVERHEGEITVSSTEGVGTTFRLAFPTRDEIANRDANAALPKRIRPVRVLVVEDDPTIARMLASMVQRLGCDTDLAATGEAALTLLDGAHYDVVISDLSLGTGINGWDLADHVRQHRPRSRFVLASGWSASISAQEAASRGVDGLLAKPYRMDEIRQLMGQLT